jgi:hypothetical protein
MVLSYHAGPQLLASMQSGLASSSPIRPVFDRCVTVSYRLCYTEHPAAVPVELPPFLTGQFTEEFANKYSL